MKKNYRDNILGHIAQPYTECSATEIVWMKLGKKLCRCMAE